MPSEPASIPTARKSRSVGTPRRNEIFPARMLAKNKNEIIRTIVSAVNVTGITNFHFYPKIDK